MNTKQHTMYWLPKFLDNKYFGKMRFKRLDVGYPEFDFDSELIETVDENEFVRIEENRLPLFIGSQFGIHPYLNKLRGFYNGDKYIAILSKSLLSGCVAGLSIYRLTKEDIGFHAESDKKVITFKNWE